MFPVIHKLSAYEPYEHCDGIMIGTSNRLVMVLQSKIIFYNLLSVVHRFEHSRDMQIESEKNQKMMNVCIIENHKNKVKSTMECLFQKLMRRN